MKLADLALLVRVEAERWARVLGDPTWRTLELHCGPVSAAFVDAAHALGMDAELIVGFFDDTAHFWAFAWENRRCHLVDLTLTQFQADAAPASIFTADDAWLDDHYRVYAFGDGARARLCAADAADGRALGDRVLARLRAVAAVMRDAKGEPT